MLFMVTEKLIMEQKLNALKSSIISNMKDMNIMIYWCQETPMKILLKTALTPPFLTEYKMVIVKNP